MFSWLFDPFGLTEEEINDEIDRVVDGIRRVKRDKPMRASPFFKGKRILSDKQYARLAVSRGLLSEEEYNYAISADFPCI